MVQVQPPPEVLGDLRRASLHLSHRVPSPLARRLSATVLLGWSRLARAFSVPRGGMPTHSRCVQRLSQHCRLPWQTMPFVRTSTGLVPEFLPQGCSFRPRRAVRPILQQSPHVLAIVPLLSSAVSPYRPRRVPPVFGVRVAVTFLLVGRVVVSPLSFPLLLSCVSVAVVAAVASCVRAA